MPAFPVQAPWSSAPKPTPVCSTFHQPQINRSAGTVAAVQLRASALRSALRKAAPPPREAFEAPRGRLGRGLRDRRLAPGALAEAAVADASTGGCSLVVPLGFRVWLGAMPVPAGGAMWVMAGWCLLPWCRAGAQAHLARHPVAGQGFHKSCTACTLLLWRCGVGAWGCVRCLHELQTHMLGA